MAKYDVYLSPGKTGYVLDVQSDLLDSLNTRVVVPLLPLAKAPKAAHRLNPVFDISGEDYVMVTQFLAAVPQSSLKEPIANMGEHFSEITAALDMVFQGF